MLECVFEDVSYFAFLVAVSAESEFCFFARRGVLVALGKKLGSRDKTL